MKIIPFASLRYSRSRRVFLSSVRLSVLLFLFVLQFAPSRAPAQEAKDVAVPVTLSTHNVFDRSDWFFLFSAGLGKSIYDSEIQSRIDEQKARGGTSLSAGYFDLLNVYRRLKIPGLALGGAINVGLEHISGKWQVRDSFAVHTYNSALSAIYFFGGSMGRGWFARSDLGYSRILQIRQTLDSAAGSERFDRINSSAIFSHTALGYGFQAGDQSRLLFFGSLFNSYAGVHTVSGLGFNIGFML